MARKLVVSNLHADAIGATAVEGVVWQEPEGSGIAGAKIGEFAGASIVADGGTGACVVDVTDFGGGALSTSDTPVVLLRNSTHTTGIIDSDVTVIDE